MLNNSRHEGIFSPHEFKHKAIHIIGLGNIGSHTAIALARMGFENFVLYDFDKVEDVNIATQAFDSFDKEILKVAAIKAKMLNINRDIKIETINKELTEESEELLYPNEEVSQSPLCFISGVDSMEVRLALKTALENSSAYNNVPVIDGRLGKEQVEVLFSEKAEDWNLEIHEDSVAEVGCTEKYISYTPLMSAALISSTVKKLCSDENIPEAVIFEFVSNNYLKLNV